MRVLFFGVILFPVTLLIILSVFVCGHSYVSRRPNIVQRMNNMNLTWIFILKFMGWFAILSNCFIFAFTSEQMEEWFPSFFENVSSSQNQIDVAGFDEMKLGKGRYVVLVMFGLEHCIAIVAWIIHFCYFGYFRIRPKPH